MKCVFYQFLYLSFLTLGAPFFSSFGFAEPLKPNVIHIGQMRVVSFYRHREEAELVKLAAEFIAHKNVLVLAGHGNEKGLLGTDGETLSIPNLAEYIIRLPEFKSTRLLYVNFCLAGSSCHSESLMKTLLDEIINRAPLHNLAVVAPTGIIELVNAGNEEREAIGVRVITPQSVRRGAKKHKNAKVIDFNDRNSFTITQRIGGESVTQPIAASKIYEHFNWRNHTRSRVLESPDKEFLTSCNVILSHILEH